MNKIKKDYTEEIEKLENRIGDREIASEIIYLSKKGGFSKRVLLTRYKNIVTLFNSLGLKVSEVIDYVKRNKRLLRLDSSIVYENYRFVANIFSKNGKTKTDLRNYVTSSFNGKNVLLAYKDNVVNIIRLFSKIFKANEKSDNELYKYLYDNRGLLVEKADTITEKLAVLSRVGLDKKIVFEDPMYLFSDVDATSINNAIECLKAKNEELTLSKIYSYAYGVIDNEDELEHNIPYDELSKLSFNYGLK